MVGEAQRDGVGTVEWSAGQRGMQAEAARRPQDVRFRNSAVPTSRLAPYLTGDKALRANSHLKPLRIRGSK